MTSLSHEKDEKPARSERYPIGSGLPPTRGDRRDEMSLTNRQTKAIVVSERYTYMVRN